MTFTRAGIIASFVVMSSLSPAASAQSPAAEIPDHSEETAPSPAEEVESPEDSLDDDGADVYEMVVVGERLESPQLEQSRSISVVGESDMRERPARTIGDYLEEEVGVQVQQTNRGAGAPFVRGQVGPSNLIVFDGIRFNNGTFRTGPNQYLNLFDPFSLRQIEVLRGSSGLLHGGDAIGGVFALVPRPLDYSRGWGSFGLARYQTADHSVTAAPEVSWSNRSFSLVAGGALNWFNDLTTGDDNRQPASSYQQFSARLRLGYLIHPETELQANYFGTWVLNAGRTDRLEDGNFREYDNGNHMTYLRLDHVGAAAFREVVATLSVNVLDEVVTRHNCTRGDVYGLVDDDGEVIETSIDPAECIEGQYDAIDGERENTDNVLTLGSSLTVASELPVEGLTLKWGGDAYYSFVDSARVDFSKTSEPGELVPSEATRGNFSDGSTYGHFGAFLQAVYDWELTARWSLRPEAGIRLTHARAFGPDVPNVGDVSYHDTGLAGGARLLALADVGLAIYTGWSQGYRPPNLQETTQVGDTGTFFEIPNPDLQPERSNELELGVRLLTDVVSFEVVGFYLLISDIITRQPATWNGQEEIDGQGIVQRVNADSGRFWGVEAGAEVWIARRLAVRGNITWIDGEIEEGESTYPPRRLQPINWLAAVRYRHPSPEFFVEALALGADAQTDLNPGDEKDLRICGSTDYPGVLLSELGASCPGTSAWVDLGFRAGVTVVDALEVTAAFSNVLDTAYRTHGSGLDAPGFNASLSVAWDF